MTPDPAVRRIGRPPLTDRPTLLAAARELGFAGLTVGVVTTAVGVKYSTFYRHFPTLDAMVTALVDDVLERELVLPGPDRSWQDQVGGTCAAVTQVFHRYPGMAAAVLALPELPAQAVSLYRHLTAVLLEAGFDDEHAAVGAVCALETVAVTELTTPGVGRALVDRQHRLDAADPPIADGVRAVTAGLGAEPPGAWTDRKIALVLRGLEAVLAARTSAG